MDLEPYQTTSETHLQSGISPNHPKTTSRTATSQLNIANPSTQDSEVNFTDIDSIEKYIRTKQEEYQSYDWKDGDLWEQFQADFSAFTEENFKNCSLRCLY